MFTEIYEPDNISTVPKDICFEMDNYYKTNSINSTEM